MILPAIDLIDGKCVRLEQGDFARQTQYALDPVSLVEDYARKGARMVHVVDLDAARGEDRQRTAIAAICRASPVPVQIGGGIRTYDHVEELLAFGAARVLVGSVAVKQPDEVCQWAEELGADKLVLALDIRLRVGTPYAAIAGWKEDTSTSLWDLLAHYDGKVDNLLVTDIDRDGLLAGPNTALYEEIVRRFPSFHLIGSGGVGSLPHIITSREAGCRSLVVGKALFEGRFTLQEAISCWRNA